MPDPLITLTTDFGDASPYVAAMKGVILGINPSVRIHDLGHRLPPQDVRHASYFLAAAIPYFPPGVLHVVVVDPGVGSERALLYVEAAGHRLLAPDNGCLTGVLAALGDTPTVRRLAEPCHWRADVSATFHGRDVLAPVAAHLSLGLDPALLGPLVSEWVRLEVSRAHEMADGMAGEIAFVDDFGNLITNITTAMLRGAPAACWVDAQPVQPVRWVRTYADAVPGETVLLLSSSGYLEIAVVQGNAARKLGAGIGTPVVVKFAPERAS